VANHRGRLAYAVELGVAEIVRTSKSPTFDTFTFQDNLTDKKEASRRWRCLKARLKRKYEGLRGVGVWQRQARGAWHLHFVFDRRLDVNEVRLMAIDCGFGAQLNMRAIGDLPGMKSGWTPIRVARYLTRYITRDISEADKGVRLADYCGDSRKATTAFRWMKGISRLYRLGCLHLFGAECDWREGRPRVWCTERECWESPFEAMWVLVRMGFNSLTKEEQQQAVQDSDAVAIWLDPGRYPF
jgi:hypothetical protein